MRTQPEGPRTEKIFELSHPVVFGPLPQGEFEEIRMRVIKGFNAIAEVTDNAWRGEPKLEDGRVHFAFRAIYFGENPLNEKFVEEKLIPQGLELEERPKR